MNRIRFQCLGKSCNRCCTGDSPRGSFVRLSNDDLKRMGDDVKRIRMVMMDPVTRERTTAGELAMFIPAGELCAHWKEGTGCSIWERRPAQCSSYPLWPHLISSPAALEAEKERCPGIGVGPPIKLTKLRRALARQWRT